MQNREMIGQQVRAFCDDLWKRGDPWIIETSEYEHARCAHLLRMLEGHRYPHVLEIGCGAGYFTRLLTRIADHIVALDVSPAAIARAQVLGTDLEMVDFRVANIMDYKPHSHGPWDLVVFSDTICYLGWLYPFFDVAWLASELFAATHNGGRLLLANSMYEGNDLLLLPYIIRTYRDLFVNVGYQIETEEVFNGTKNSVDFEVLITLFRKATA